MAIYKKLENGDWLKAEESVFIPVRIDKDNLQDGWEYHENDPQEYLDFIEQQNNQNSMPPVIDDIGIHYN